MQIFFGETTVSAYMCTQTPTHMSVYTIYNQLKQTLNRDLLWRKVAAWSGKHGRSIILVKRNVLRLDLSESREGFITELYLNLFTDKHGMPNLKTVVEAMIDGRFNSNVVHCHRCFSPPFCFIVSC